MAAPLRPESVLAQAAHEAEQSGASGKDESLQDFLSALDEAADAVEAKQQAEQQAEQPLQPPPQQQQQQQGEDKQKKNKAKKRRSIFSAFRRQKAPAAGSSSPEAQISGVLEVQRSVHVEIDHETGSISQMPPEWKAVLGNRFGLPVSLCKRQPVDGYAAPVPVVLLELRARLEELGGLDTVGIFRVPADAVVLKRARDEVNGGAPVGGAVADVHVAAGLLKCWLREMPTPLLASVREADVLAAAKAGPRACWNLVRILPEQRLSLLLWLLDLCVAVAARREATRMTAHNLAVVFAPNLLRHPAEHHGAAAADPDEMLASMRRFKDTVRFVEALIEVRRDEVAAGRGADETKEPAAPDAAEAPAAPVRDVAAAADDDEGEDEDDDLADRKEHETGEGDEVAAA